jgi:hypothetical protein
VKPNGLDLAELTALVARTIRDIEESDDEQRRALLVALVCAAWGSSPGQDQ